MNSTNTIPRPQDTTSMLLDQFVDLHMLMSLLEDARDAIDSFDGTLNRHLNEAVTANHIAYSLDLTKMELEKRLRLTKDLLESLSPLTQKYLP